MHAREPAASYGRATRGYQSTKVTRVRVKWHGRERPRKKRGSDWHRSPLATNNPYPRGEEAVFTGPEGGRSEL